TVKTISSENTSMEQVEKTTGCPDEGTCTVVVHKNKKLAIKQDGIGSTYPEITDGENMVVEFTYLKKGPEGTADGDYSETIHFEIPANTENFTKVNTALSDVELLYGKHCFCKGEAGYYPITEGTLLLEKNEVGIVFNLNFKVNKTSQVISHISEMVKL